MPIRIMRGSGSPPPTRRGAGHSAFGYRAENLLQEIIQVSNKFFGDEHDIF
jgi:hypothetical protein